MWAAEAIPGEARFNLSQISTSPETAASTRAPDLVVFYTFDAPADHTNPNIKMLQLSIYSVLREFSDPTNNVVIRVYTSKPATLAAFIPRHPRISIHSVPVEISTLIEGASIDPSLADNIYRAVNGRPGTPHARAFIFSELLQELRVPILYLDNDTGLSRGSGNEILKGLSKLPSVFTDALYHHSLFDDMMEESPFLTAAALPEWVKVPTPRYCAGIVFIKPNQQGLAVAERLRDNYIRLTQEIGFLASNDEYALGLAFAQTKVKATYCHRYYDPRHKDRNVIDAYTDFLREQAEDSLLKIIHYGQQKYDSPATTKRILTEWADFLSSSDRTRDEPRFPVPTIYTDVENIVWGRLEAI